MLLFAWKHGIPFNILFQSTSEKVFQLPRNLDVFGCDHWQLLPLTAHYA